MKASFYTPVVTAFTEQGEIDVKGNQNIFEHLIKGGIEGVLILGSSGEFYTLSMEQKKAMIDMAIPYINHRMKVFIGTACDSVEDTVELGNYAMKAGADGVMVISPYYFVINDASIEAFYDEVAEKVDGPVYIYNFPARTGYDVKPEIVYSLLKKHSNIVGLKDSVAEMGHTRKLINLCKKDFPEFQVYSGFDENLIHNIACGGAGCIGGLSNVYPEICRRWTDEVNAGNWEAASETQKVVDELMNFYDINPFFIATLKKAMILRGVEIEDWCKKPVLSATEADTEKIKEIIAKVEG